MTLFSSFLLALALFFGLRAVPGIINKKASNRYRDEEIERTRHVLERDPTNSGTRAKLAEFLIEDGELEAGIHEYRTAISQMPHGPFTAQWKRKLRDALDTQAILARGERVPDFNEWRVCERCQAQVAASAKTCPKCNAVIRMDFMEWLLQPGNKRDIVRETIPIVLMLWVAAVIFMNLTLEWKGTLIISSVMVGGWLILRSMDK